MNLYYHEDEFYVYSGVAYRKSYKIQLNNSSMIVKAFDIETKQPKMAIAKFKRLNNSSECGNFSFSAL